MQIQEGRALCMECWSTFQRTNQENQRLAYAMINFFGDQMAWMAGVENGPRIQIPTPTYLGSGPVTMNTTNNIHVESGSQVGQINAGALVYLDRAVSSFKNTAGGADFATALQTFTQAVVDSAQVSQQGRGQILDLLRELVEQIQKPKDQRNPSIAKLALLSIQPLISTVSTLADHWEKLRIFFGHLL